MYRLSRIFRFFSLIIPLLIAACSPTPTATEMPTSTPIPPTSTSLPPSGTPSPTDDTRFEQTMQANQTQNAAHNETQSAVNTSIALTRDALTPTPSQTPLPSHTPTPTENYAAVAATHIAAAQPITLWHIPGCTISTPADIWMVESPIITNPIKLMSSEKVYEGYGWQYPNVLVGRHDQPMGWVNFFTNALVMDDACLAEDHHFSELGGLPFVCTFVAIGKPAAMYQAPDENGASIGIQSAYYASTEGAFYHVTFGTSGPSGFVLQSSGKLYGYCP